MFAVRAGVGHHGAAGEGQGGEDGGVEDGFLLFHIIFVFRVLMSAVTMYVATEGVTSVTGVTGDWRR